VHTTCLEAASARCSNGVAWRWNQEGTVAVEEFSSDCVTPLASHALPLDLCLFGHMLTAAFDTRLPCAAAFPTQQAAILRYVARPWRCDRVPTDR
jgi:hypothetical protein